MFAREEFVHPVRINAAGWRDSARSLAKAPGAYRIAVLGDSFTWGQGVPDDEIYTRVMESVLPGSEVLNFGLSGSSTDQQLLILRRFALAYSPDLVLVMITRNDFHDVDETQISTYGKPQFVLREDGGLDLTNVPVPEVSAFRRFHYRLRRRSALLTLAERSVRGMLKPRPVVREVAAADIAEGEGRATTAGSTAAGNLAPEQNFAEAPVTQHYELLFAILSAMRDETVAAGARFAVAIAPLGAHTYPEEIPAWQVTQIELLKQFGERDDVPVLDLVPAFRAAARSDPAGPSGHTLHYKLDLHWNAAAHRLAARTLARLLEEEGLLPADLMARKGPRF